MDKPALKPLPKTPYQYTEFKLARVNIDYHVEFEQCYYSVPHHLVKHQIEIQATGEIVAAFFEGKPVAKHPRSRRPGAFSTDTNHMPHAHREHHTWTPERLK
ncbi:Mu transposase domain-containing protein [Vibrio sp.]|uniref:Mu transposase domain-containing protein n=1 Tax=Vibrio sp. TaxID=678 RepID=UPI003D0DC61A